MVYLLEKVDRPDKENTRPLNPSLSPSLSPKPH